MTYIPIEITRIDADHYIVGRVHLLRTDGGWGAFPYGDRGERPLFTRETLEEILEMAHGAVEMMRPA